MQPRSLALALALALAGCAPAAATPDIGALDASFTDATALDASGDDAATVDATTGDAGATSGIALPPGGGLYHGVYPGGTLGWEDDITLTNVTNYEAAAGRQVAWVYFSNNWFSSRAFPLATATFIRDHGAIPFIRLMLRSRLDAVTGPDPSFPLDRIAAGDFDADLDAWGASAAAFDHRSLVEWGTEMNGSWFSWNGMWNGGSGAGPARFVEVYRRIVNRFRAAGAANITFVFHVSAYSGPPEAWNDFENYYPGDAYADWIGMSAYGAQTPAYTFAPTLRDALDAAVPRLVALAPTRPIFLFEFGCSGGSANVDAPAWADEALGDVLGHRWPEIRGFAWWNETWPNDSNPAHDSDMRVQTVPGLSAVFQRRLVGSSTVIDRPIFR